MAVAQTRKIAFISSYLPRRCGIATFCNDLITNLSAHAKAAFEPLVATMISTPEHIYSDPVKFEIRKNVKNDYLCAADYLNFSQIDQVCVQHEFGLFGGPAGAYLNLLLKRINVPVVTTLHTVLNDPNDEYRQATIEICNNSSVVIVMNQRGTAMLESVYGISSDKIRLIPHGIPDLSFVDSSYYKHKFGTVGRKTILTFGLLSRNKGIEHMLKAMPAIVESCPNVLYIILGATHPDVIRHDGEEYRFELQRITRELGLQNNVKFYNQFVSDEQLHQFLCAADIYVTPYQNREQLTSGTLAFAVGTGKAVVSTPYWAAEELLADERGKIVDFGETMGLSNAVIELLNDEALLNTLRQRAYDYGRTMTWPEIAKKYWQLFSETQLIRKTAPEILIPKSGSETLLDIPEPALDHLVNLTDDTGLIQHGKYILPNRNHGYCTDDNARAVVAMVKYYHQQRSPDILGLLNTYLAFLYHAQREDGTFHNFMDYNRQWQANEPAHDGLGRALWALGTALRHPPQSQIIPVVKNMFDCSISHTNTLSPRGKAYAMFGMRDYLKQFPGASEIKRHLYQNAEFLADLYKNSQTPSWRWFEKILAYDNAVLPHGLFEAYLATGVEEYLDIASVTCDFLLENIFNGSHFSFVGCNGWYPEGGSKAQFDQQPVEAMSTVLMLAVAYEATGNPNYLVLQKKAFDWFTGDNDLSIPLYDFRTRGCSDGLMESGVNQNQGAESLLCFLIALLVVNESEGPQRNNAPQSPPDGHNK